MRGSGPRQVCVPYVDEGKAKTLVPLERVGMHVSRNPASLHPGALVIMGGLLMPNVTVNAVQVKEVIGRHPGADVIGVCFMNMSEKAGWLPGVRFDLLIDATIDPVKASGAGS
jgi:hypothetical protein